MDLKELYPEREEPARTAPGPRPPRSLESRLRSIEIGVWVIAVPIALFALWALTTAIGRALEIPAFVD